MSATIIKDCSPATNWWFRLCFWLIAGTISLLALYPNLTLPEPEATQGLTQYANHALAFSVLVLIGALGWGLRGHLIPGVAAGAVGLELTQFLSPGRQTTLEDMAASLAGVAIGWGLARAWRGRALRIAVGPNFTRNRN